MSARNLDNLVEDLTPVQRRSTGRYLVYGIVGFAAAVALDLAMLGLRPGLTGYFTNPEWLWKGGSMAALALFGGILVARAGRPGGISGLSRIGILLPALLLLVPALVVSVLDPDYARTGATMIGTDCTMSIIGATIPAWIATLLWYRRMAPTEPERASLAAGLASAGAGALAFVLSCPHDNVIFVAIWFGLAITIVTIASRLILPRLIRW